MKRLIFKKGISIFLAVLMCIGCITCTGVVSASEAQLDLYLRGSFNDWNGISSDYMMETTDGDNYTISIPLNAGSYTFKAGTSNWSYGLPKQDASVALDYDGTLTVTVNKTANKLNYEVEYLNTLYSSKTNTILRCVWDQHSDAVLAQEGDSLKFYNYGSDNMPESNYTWNIIPADGGIGVYVQNVDSGQYLAADSNDVFTFIDEPLAWGSQFIGGNIILKNGDKSINIENWQTGVELSYQPAKNTSTQWNFYYESYNYTMKADKVIDTGFEAVANSGKSITSYATGRAKTWNLTEDISQYPTFTAPNTPLAEAAYNLSLEEIVKNTYVDPQVGEVFRTGTAWNKVWTRDTAYSNLLSLSWINPEVATNCSYKKVHTDDNTGVKVFEQDTGTGGSYPTSTDKIITLISVWETYLSNGNTEDLEYFYDVAYNTMMQDLHVAMDDTTGLFKGETGGIDWRDQTYPDWMSSKWNSGMVDIAEGKSAVVNATYVRAYEIMARMADILGKGQEAVDFWTKAATELEKAMSEQLWHDDLGMYASWMYPEYMGNPLSGKGDIQGNGYALWFDVGTPEQIQSILKNFPLVNYGAPTTYPQKMGNGEHAQRYYHNRGIWPGWQTIMMVGANLQGNETIAEEIFDSNIRTAATYLSNYEVVNYETGEGIHSSQQLWSIAGTLAGYYRLIFGMNYEEDGITFNPTVQDWMVGPLTLSNYKYRNADLTITVNGTGDKVTSFKVDGVEEDIATYVFSKESTGKHTIEITLDGTEGEEDIMTQGDEYLVICPKMPTMSYNKSTNTLTWTPVQGLAYKLWTGKDFVDVTGKNSYVVDPTVYGSYSLVSVSANGIESEFSEPIVVSPTRIKLEAEDGSASSTAVIKNSRSGYSGTGYVVDNLGRSAELQVVVDVATSGKYLLHGIYNNIGAGQDGLSCGIRSVYVDGEDVGTMVFPEVYAEYTWQESSHLALELSAGRHIIKVVYDTTNVYDQNMAWYAQFDIASDLKDYVYGIEYKNSIELDYLVLDLVEAKAVDKQPLDPNTTLPTTPQGEDIPDYTYTIAGTASLCGSEWSPADTKNDMTYVGKGVYQKVYTNVSAGSHQFKVAQNHGWEVSYGQNGGSSNYILSINKAGATVTITFNDANKVATTLVEYPGETTESTEPTTEITESTEPSTDSTETTDETEKTEPTEMKKPTIKIGKKSLKAGQKTVVKVVNAGGKKITYSSSKKKVASVDKNGVVRALGKGTTYIKAKISGYGTIKCKIKVTTSPVLMDGKKKAKSIVVKKGNTKKITIKGKVSDIKNVYKNTKTAKIVSKTSSSTLKVRGLKKGKTTITVKVNKYYTLKLKVKVK